MQAKLLAAFLTFAAFAVHAETGRDAWLRYAPLSGAAAQQARNAVPRAVVALGDAAPIASARQEIVTGLQKMLGAPPTVANSVPAAGAIVIGTLDRVRQAFPQGGFSGTLAEDSYWIKTVRSGNASSVVITGPNARGVLYGAFAYLRKINLRESVATLDDKQTPYAPVRWVNQWDNLDGSIERGYGGRSIFWDANKSRADLSRVSEYGRLLASLGINACDISNVNSNVRLLAADFMPEIERIAAAFRPWGVQVAISVDFSSPQKVGGLDTFDPLDPRVVAFWKNKVDDLYRVVPDLAGFVLKADSEGRIGPSAYKRTHADASNVIARALKPHNGLFFYRGFVYDNRMDWRNLKNDRGRAAWDNFHDLDGKFEDNVFIQIKNGPIDFQVREPASPLFAALEKTNLVIELQITQEYFGQGRQTTFLVPMWKEVLDFDMRAHDAATPVKALVAGKVFKRPSGGFVGVANVGMDDNWLLNHMSQSNLYGFGRLAWNPDLSSERINDEWARLTFSDDPKLLKTVADIQLSSWLTFEKYTGPLGLQTLTDMTGDHYSVNVDASERNGWGQWHRADEQGVGMDRTVATGTGFIGQFPPAVAKMYESLATCPDDLLLFMHHVPYTYKLRNGKTVIQYIYDSHYEGAAGAEKWVDQWRAVKGLLDDERYNAILSSLDYQAGQAIVWRDAVNNWFNRASKIPDAQGRVGNYPGRYEAESMKLEGYTPVDVTPWENAGNGKAIRCPGAPCTAVLPFTGAAGTYTVTVRYFDQNNGTAKYRLLKGAQLLSEWTADDRVPNSRLGSSTSTRRVFKGIALKPGDEIRIEGTPERAEVAALDYIEITPERR